MGNYLKRVALFFALIVTVPFAIGFIGSSSAGTRFLMFLLGIPAAFLILLVGTIAWIVRGFRVFREAEGARDRLVVSCAVSLLFVATILVFWPLLAAGSFTGSVSRLMVNRSHYEAIIAKARATQKPAWFEDDDGVTYSVDLGPPVRVAFNPAGLLDNWSGIIYDPSGEVMLADGFDPQTGKFAAPDRVTKLFGGDLVSCRHLWHDYYDCSFT